MTLYPHSLQAVATPSSTEQLIVLTIAPSALRSARVTIEQVANDLNANKPDLLADCGARDHCTLAIYPYAQPSGTPTPSFSAVITSRYFDSIPDAVTSEHVETYACAEITDDVHQMSEIVKAVMGLHDQGENNRLDVDVILVNHSESSQVMLPDCGDTVTIDGVEYTNSPYRARVEVPPGAELKFTTTYWPVRRRDSLMNHVGSYHNAMKRLYGPPMKICSVNVVLHARTATDGS
jgi:hypothetical protein